MQAKATTINPILALSSKAKSSLANTQQNIRRQAKQKKNADKIKIHRVSTRNARCNDTQSIALINSKVKQFRGLTVSFYSVFLLLQRSSFIN